MNFHLIQWSLKYLQKLWSCFESLCHLNLKSSTKWFFRITSAIFIRGEHNCVMILFLIRKLGKELIRKIQEPYFIFKIYLEVFRITIITDLCHFDTSLINIVLMHFLIHSLWITMPSFIKAQPNSNVF